MPANNGHMFNTAIQRAPGVYIEEVVPQSSPDFQTGVPMFVGFVEADLPTNERGKARTLRLESAPENCRAVLLTAWEEFSQAVGTAVHDGFLDYAVRGFFENGGLNCVVVCLWRIAGWDAQKTALSDLFRDGGPLEDIHMIDLVCVPDIMTGGARSSDELSPELRRDILEIQETILAYCRRMGDRFAIFDGWKGLAGTRALQRYSYRGMPLDGAGYFPWIHTKPLRRHQGQETVNVPPCGHVAGIYARVDRQAGVHKTPANELVEGVVDLAVDLKSEDQIALNEMGLNCLRSFSGRGIRVWGGRTLSSLENWKYVNVRRLFLSLVRWCRASFDDMIFEPNNSSSWSLIRDRARAYCYKLFQHGALKGNSPEEAFFVKCDAETNPLEIREAGQLVCEIGLAAVVPAEFIIVRITRNVSGIITTFSPSS